MKRTCKLTVWVIILLMLLGVCAFVLSLAADANAETAVSELSDPYELPEDSGEVILDDPALFLSVEDDESGELLPANTEAADAPVEDDEGDQQNSDIPTQDSTAEPTDEPVQEPTNEPTDTPAQEPPTEPTDTPTQEPTTEPTGVPTQEPTTEPTDTPTQEPTTEPTDTATQEPTTEPTQEPTPPPV